MSQSMSHTLRPQRRERGFTLIELLVAVLILSIGLLGVASLQVAGLKQGKGGVQAAEATAFAYSLADLMRANKAGAIGYIVNTTKAQPGAPGKDCNTASCNELELAAFDLYYWLNNQNYTDANGRTTTAYGLLNALGPGAQAIVACKDTPCTPTSVYDIAVLWDQNRKSKDGTPATGTDCANPAGPPNPNVTSDPTQLACVVVSVQL